MNDMFASLVNSGIWAVIKAVRFGLSSWPAILAISLLSGALGAALIVTNAQVVAGYSLLAEGLMRHYMVRCTVFQYHTPHFYDGK